MTSNHKKALERPRYFRGQLMTLEEMTLEQNYFLEKLRRHNRMLHGWRVVCGLEVNQDQNGDEQPVPWSVTISPGFAIDPLGNEIFVPQTVTFDLRRGSMSSCELVQGKADDPYRSDVLVEPGVDEEIYLAICYEECPARPVRVTASGCNCGSADCENSRVRDGYRLLTLNTWPEIYNQELNNSDCLNVDNHLLSSPIVLAIINKESVENLHKIRDSPMQGLETLSKICYELEQENEELRKRLDISSSITEYLAKLTETKEQYEKMNREIDNITSFSKSKVKNLANTIGSVFKSLETKIDNALIEIKSLKELLPTEKIEPVGPDLISVHGIGDTRKDLLMEIGIKNVFDLLITDKEEIRAKLKKQGKKIIDLENIIATARSEAEESHGGSENLELTLVRYRKEKT